MLGREPTAKDIVRGRHDLDAQAVQIGVDVPRREVDHFTGFEGQMVQEQGNEDAGVAGEGFIDVQHCGQRFPVRLQRCPGRKYRDYLVNGIGDVTAALDEPAEGSLQRSGSISLRKVGDDVGDNGGNVDGGGVKDVRQVFKDAAGVSRGAEAAQRLEGREGEDHFRLVVVIAVVAFSGVGGDPGGVLAGKSFTGLLQARMDLEGKRLFGRQELGEEGQAGTKSGEAFGAKEALRIRGDQGIQGLGDTVGVNGCRRGVRVGPDPHFGLRAARGLPAQQSGDGRRRTPRIGPQNILNLVHERKSLSLRWTWDGAQRGNLQWCALAVGGHEVADALLIALGFEAVQQLNGDRRAVGGCGHRSEVRRG
ncbi:hypothetical protein PJL18_02722 [Paenarthrobacter nicotinovorans]|nr:hypothetical protein [Paenarthrobacter nicotinovorans]